MTPPHTTRMSPRPNLFRLSTTCDDNLCGSLAQYKHLAPYAFNGHIHDIVYTCMSIGHPIKYLDIQLFTGTQLDNHMNNVELAYAFHSMDILLCFWGGLLSIEYPSVTRAARQSQLWKSAKARFRHHLLILKRPRARLAGPETMIHSPNRFALPCAGPFHKINAEYEATTTVNSSCLMYGYYFDAILLN